MASDETRGHLPVDACLERESVAGHPVDDAVVERLADPTHLGGDFIWPHTVEAGGGEGMDVLALSEGLAQRRLPGHMRQHPKFYLRVVRAKQHGRPAYSEARGVGHKRAADLRPNCVRTGMFWRLGSLETRRPLLAETWLKLVCTRPVCGFTRPGSGSV